MGEWSIIPNARQTVNIAVTGDYDPAEAMELGLLIIASAQAQARRNGTPRLTFAEPVIKLAFRGPEGT